MFTETSRTAILHEEVLQDSSSSNSDSNFTCAHYITLHYNPENSPSSIQNPILHAEDRELFEYYYWCNSRFQKRNSTHRRQGDLLEMHPCVLQGIPGIPAARPSKGTPVITDIPVFPDIPDIPIFPVFPVFPDIPVVHDLPAFPGNSTNSTKFQYLQGFHPSTAFSN